MKYWQQVGLKNLSVNLKEKKIDLTCCIVYNQLEILHERKRL